MKTFFTLILSFMILAASAENRPGSSKPFPGPAQNPSISVVGLGSGITANDLVASLVGPGISYSNVSFTGVQGGTTTASAGSFANGMTIFGIDQGVVLSSGRVANGPGPNAADNTTSANGLPGDANLDAIFGGGTQDACVLEFDFVPTADQMYVQYVFASEEYNEYVNSSYIDCFAFFLDGVNIAHVAGTSTPVSINSVNLNVNPTQYLNNDYGDFGGVCPFDLEADGFTKVFTASGSVTPNQTHHIKLVIADKGDAAFDSWVYLKGASFSTVNPNIPTLSEWGLIILGLSLLAFGTFYIFKLKA
jgi:hypothetical protein